MKTLAASIVTAFAFTLATNAADSTAKISEVHLCCQGCTTGVEKAVSKVPNAKAQVDQHAGTVILRAVDRATASVPGVKAHTATRRAKSFEVTGDFNDEDLMTAFQKEGLTGKIAE